MSRDVRGACALYYSYQVKDATGRITVPFRRRTAHSFLTAYIQFLYLKFVSATSRTITDTGGTGRTISSVVSLKIRMTAGDASVGLVVGTGVTAVAFTDTKLVTQIAHGTSASTLDHGASVVNLPTSDSTSTSLIHTRVFANSSGGTITVREIGIYVHDDQNTSFKFCIVRDLATIALSNGDQLTLNYILKTTA